MLRQLMVKNFRSLVEFSLDVPSQYLCIVGENNVGKSNIVTALKWLANPRIMSANGVPSADLSRTASGLEIQIAAAVSVDDGRHALPDGRLLTWGDDLVGVARIFSFTGQSTDPQRLVVESEYAPLKSNILRTYLLDGQAEWTPFDFIEEFLPQVVHIKPSDIGQARDHPSAEGQLSYLRWPEELDESDLKWVSEKLARLFNPPSLQVINLVIHEETRGIGIWDHYGYPVPLIGSLLT